MPVGRRRWHKAVASSERNGDEWLVQLEAEILTCGEKSWYTVVVGSKEGSQSINQSKVLTKPHTGKDNPHPSTTTEGSKPCVTKCRNKEESSKRYE